MGIFSRFMDIVNANINALLDKAEDPEKMIKLMMQEIEDTLIELKSSCASYIAKESESKRNQKESESKIERWMKRAELAIEKGRDDLAREALIEKRRLTEEFDRFVEDAKRFEELASKGKEDIQRLEEKLSSLRLKHKALKERLERARDAERASDALRKSSEESIFSRFDQMERDFDRMGATESFIS